MANGSQNKAKLIEVVKNVKLITQKMHNVTKSNHNLPPQQTWWLIEAKLEGNIQSNVSSMRPVSFQKSLYRCKVGQSPEQSLKRSKIYLLPAGGQDAPVNMECLCNKLHQGGDAAENQARGVFK